MATNQTVRISLGQRWFFPAYLYAELIVAQVRKWLGLPVDMERMSHRVARLCFYPCLTKC